MRGWLARRGRKRNLTRESGCGNVQMSLEEAIHSLEARMSGSGTSAPGGRARCAQWQGCEAQRTRDSYVTYLHEHMNTWKAARHPCRCLKRSDQTHVTPHFGRTKAARLDGRQPCLLQVKEYPAGLMTCCQEAARARARRARMAGGMGTPLQSGPSRAPLRGAPWPVSQAARLPRRGQGRPLGRRWGQGRGLRPRLSSRPTSPGRPARPRTWHLHMPWTPSPNPASGSSLQARLQGKGPRGLATREVCRPRLGLLGQVQVVAVWGMGERRHAAGLGTRRHCRARPAGGGRPRLPPRRRGPASGARGRPSHPSRPSGRAKSCPRHQPHRRTHPHSCRHRGRCPPGRPVRGPLHPGPPFPTGIRSGGGPGATCGLERPIWSPWHLRSEARPQRLH